MSPTFPRLALILTLLLCVSATGAWADPIDHPYVPGEFIIKFTPGTSDNVKTLILTDLDAEDIRGFGRIKAALKRSGSLTVEEAIARYQDHPNVEFIEPNYVLTANETPNDTRYPELWGMNNTGQTGGTAGADISAEMAWDVFTGNPNIVVGVIDTGVDYNHLDLVDNMWTNPGEIPANGVDDDGNGYVDDIHGWDFYNDDNDPMDDNGHGTHCSGTIGGTGNNATGVAGVNWQVRIMALKFLSGSGSGSTADAVAAVEYATDMALRYPGEVRLTSNSWGGGGFSQALYDAIADAQSAEMLFVAAAGNSSSNNDVSPHYPSNYDLDNIISVAATNHNDDLAGFSSYGVTTVDLAAPGVDILSTVPGNSYSLASGTSMATPHVAGVAALTFGRFPAVSALDAKSLILSGADPLDNLAGVVLTGARLNAFWPIAEPDSIAPDPVTDLASGRNPAGFELDRCGLDRDW
jgi:subtilisin family serine protease